METVGGNGFNNVFYKQNLIDAPVLWGQNMISLECLIGQNKSVVFTLYDNFGRKIPTQFGDIEQVNEIQNDYSDTLLYFQPQDMDKFIDVVDKARQGFKFEKEIETNIGEARTQKHIPKSIITEQDIEEYKDFAQAAVQKNQQTFIYRAIRTRKESENIHEST
ncbi:MAG: hypothetical protein EZS28_018970 [Streblomastix strix]|uniref:Uncharacterized protein n=1 Tax=Streblomastix strix TaxID=222440 RepID=A0A5J4VSD9_9EUKA|nr:MAG: hypothetical protein EZS28_018970 [Streblomastix strix]